MTELEHTPASVAAAFAKLAAIFVLLTLMGNWGAAPDYTITIPFVLMPVLVWFAFVPKRFRYGAEGFEFTSRWTGTHRISPDALRHWGEGQSVYLLEFDKGALGRRTQIALSFYPREARGSFLNFLRAKFPEQETSVWFGIRGYTLPWLR